MVPSVLFMLVGALVLGMILLVLGLRGRRLNDHPVCRGCAFDLSGVYPECVTCPECGAGLKREGAIRKGVRRRMYSVALFGLALQLVAVAPIVGVGYAAITGSDVNALKPLGLLLWEANRADATRGAKLADEIMRRILAGNFAPDQYQRVIQHVLELQGDTKKPWSENWGEIIERAAFDGVLKPEHQDRFYGQAAVFEVVTRPTMSAGANAPMQIKLVESRVGSSTALICLARIGSVRLGGVDAKVIGPKRAERRQMTIFSNGALGLGATNDSIELGTFTITGSSAGRRFGGLGSDSAAGRVFVAPDSLSAGAHTLEVDLEIVPVDARGMRTLAMINGRLVNPGSDQSGTKVTVTANANVVAPGEPVVRAQEVTSDQAETLSTKLRPAMVSRPGVGAFGLSRPATNEASVTFDCGDLPLPVSYDVFIKSGEAEFKVGNFASGAPINPPDSGAVTSSSTSFTVSINGVVTSSSSSFNSKDGRVVSGPATKPLGREVDVILRPSPDAALETMDQETYANRELVFKQVPVEQDPFIEMQERMNQMLQQGGRGRVRPGGR